MACNRDNVGGIGGFLGDGSTLLFFFLLLVVLFCMCDDL